jgi:hypothetical protein
MWHQGGTNVAPRWHQGGTNVGPMWDQCGTFAGGAARWQLPGLSSFGTSSLSQKWLQKVPDVEPSLRVGRQDLVAASVMPIRQACDLPD